MILKMACINIIKETFVKEFSKYIDETYKISKKVYGVSIAPVFIEKNGDAYMTLGKERAGENIDKFNYFGGKVSDKDKETLETLSELISHVLFEETFEEMGYVLTPEIINSIVDVIETDYANGISLIFVCNIGKMDEKKWSDIMYKRRENPDLPWRYEEMSEIQHILVETIPSRRDVSKYVKNSLYSILPCFPLLKKSNYVNIEIFDVSDKYDIF
jgi:hypothetical protein